MPRLAPAVFAVENEYQIMAAADAPSLFRVRVGETIYEDADNGIMRTDVPVHRVRVPAKALNRAGSYTVIETEMKDRLPYRSETGEVRETVYRFFPVPESGARAYHISDCHNLVDEPIRAARAFGDFDFLILNGDILDSSCDERDFLHLYQIADALTAGEKPIVFARGNHDLRGFAAEAQQAYAPRRDGCVYYTFRLGSLWGIVLDCGEDKPDDHPEYGNTAAFHTHRVRVGEYLKETADRGEYLDPAVTHRLVVCHIPFCHQRPNFVIVEPELYPEWARIIGDRLRADVMICGHTHSPLVAYPGGEMDQIGQPCPLVIGGRPGSDFAGCGYEFLPDRIRVSFTSAAGGLFETKEIPLKR